MYDAHEVIMNPKLPGTKGEGQRPTDSPATQRWIPGLDDAELKRILETRARGDGGRFVFMRPLCEPYTCPDPDPGDDAQPPNPCGGLPWVWMPDIAVQLNTFAGQCPSEEDLSRIRNGVGGNLSSFRVPDPDVRVRCEAGRIDIRIWSNRVQPHSCADEARRRAELPDLAAGGNFGLFLNSGLIRRLADEAFQSAPKRLNANGGPDPFGPIHLTGLSVGFKSPDAIVTTITGYDERPWPDVHFTTTITDRLRPLLGTDPPTVQTSTNAGELIALWLAALVVAAPTVLPAAAFSLFVNIDAAANQPDADGQGGVGKRLLANLPVEIPLPRTGGFVEPIYGPMAAVVNRRSGGLHFEQKKLVLLYAAPTVDDGGLFVSGLARMEDRVPAVQLAGPTSLSLATNAAQTFGYYTATPDDILGQRTITWSDGADIVVHNPGQPHTRISFKRGNAAAGTTFQRTVSVRVTDSEGTSVAASQSVSVVVNEAGELSPTCQAKPWLPECNP
jgi:hypothetical protein